MTVERTSALGRKRVKGPVFDCIHRLFEEQAALGPDRVAVLHGERSFTYRELNRQANALAHRLIERGVRPNDVIALFADRSLSMVAGVLGILKAGASYVPLDPDYPKDRLAFLVSDSQAPLVVVPSELFDRLPSINAEILRMPDGGEDRNPVTRVTAEDLAYVIYTSGSTGIPKGVLLPHRGLTSLMTSTRDLMEIRDTDRILQFASFSFDASLWEIFAALISGAALVVGDRDSLLPGPTLYRLLKEQRVSIALLSPSVLRMLDPDGLDELRIMVAGTEKLTSDIVKRWAPGRRFFNADGPTETTIYSTLLEVREIRDEAPSIGSAVPNTDIYILGDDLKPVPPGESGELAIGGIGVARGYLNRDALTAEKFVTVSFDGGEPCRIYLTGDRARMRADGNVDYQGRTDFQVKVRGFRVELPEIEAALEKHPAVGSAAVLDGGDALGQTVLWAYFVPEPGKSAAPAELRSFLAGRLPDYMVPSAYTELSLWPLSPNGKLDRKALPPPAMGADDSPDSGLTPTERALQDLVSEVLEGGKVHRDDSFAVFGLHSLSLAQLVLRIEKNFDVRLKYSEVATAGTLGGLAEVVDRRERSQERPQSTPPSPAVDGVPLSFAQERIWFLERLHPECRAYQFQSVFRIQGPLDVPALERSLNEIVSRHEILRTSFPLVDGRPMQRVHPFEPFALEVEDRDLDIEREGERPFDLARTPLVRWNLFRIGEEDFRLLHREHHFLHDGWSYGVFLEELHECYRAFSKGTKPDLPPPSLQYREFAVRERERFERGELASEIEYWKTKLAGAPPPPSLPSDRPRPKTPSFRGGQIRKPLGPETYSRLLSASAREGVTPFTWLHAVFQVFLHRYTGATDFVVGSGFANRGSSDTEGMLGMVINTVPVRGQLEGALSFRDHLKEVSRTLLEAADHQSAPFEAVVRAINPDRSSGQVLFNTFLDSYDRPYAELRAPGLVVSREDGISNGAVKFDLVVLVVPRTAAEGRVDSANLLWEYSSDLFDRSSAERMLVHFWNLLEASLDDPGCAIDRLRMSPSEERARISSFGEATKSSYPRNAAIPALFEEQAALRPEAIAVTAIDGVLTYSELNRRANRLARRLRSEGVGPEVVVALALERSAAAIVALLGILKAGGSYHPLDLDSPRDRRDLTIRDAGAKLVVDERYLESLSGESGANLEALAGPETLAYVMYTSGSTGAPKGVAVDHRAVVRLVKDPGYVELGPEETLLHLAPISFDASTFEIWGALLNGARLAVFPPRAASLQELGRFLEEREVTTLWLTAPLFHQMVDVELERLSRVRQILAGGDVLSAAQVRKLLSRLPAGARLVNGYGPTENTTFTCCHVMTSGSDVGASVPIGRPVPGTRIEILDEHLEPVGIGVPGELYAGGDGLARGYVGRPDLTRQKFVSGKDGSRLYRTGDFCRFREDGAVEFLGRRDRQVKIRGFRCELTELETVLEAHPKVGSVAVVAHEDALVAYVVPRGAEPLEYLELRGFLEERLPGYMVPSSLMFLEELPLTGSGKIDREKLPSVRSSSREVSIAPRTETEMRVAAIWRDVLGVEELSIEDDFFSLGGHSLLATRIVNRLESSFGVEVPLSALFDSGTVAGIARILEGGRGPRPEQGEL